jgi:hypothetical protein
MPIDAQTFARAEIGFTRLVLHASGGRDESLHGNEVARFFKCDPNPWLASTAAAVLRFISFNPLIVTIGSTESHVRVPAIGNGEGPTSFCLPSGPFELPGDLHLMSSL